MKKAFVHLLKYVCLETLAFYDLAVLNILIINNKLRLCQKDDGLGQHFQSKVL